MKFNKVESWNWPWTHWIVQPGECSLVTERLVQGVYDEVPAKDWFGWDCHYDNDCERGKRITTKVHEVGPFTGTLFRMLNSDEFLVTLREMTGVADLQADPFLHGAGLHITEPGGHLSPHLDYSRHPKLGDMERRLNLILFLNPKWDLKWGGAFELYDDEARKVECRVCPEPGKFVLWVPSDLAYHGTQKVKDDCPELRVTAACYYLSKARIESTRKRALFVPNRGEM